MEAEATRPALAELKEAGAVLGGADKSSVAAAVMTAVDLAASKVDLAAVAAIAFLFDPNGDIHLHALAPEAVSRVSAALLGEGATEVVVAAADLEAAFEAAVEGESIPPPPPEGA